MQCERCGGLIGNKVTRINGVTICEKCAKSMGINLTSRMGAFPMLDELTNAIMATGTDLEFTTSQIACPRCGTKYREFELNNRVGCIECYNFFNNSIVKINLRLQGSCDYKGRKPGENADISPEIEISSVDEEKQDNQEEQSPFVRPLNNNGEKEDNKGKNSESESSQENKKKTLYEKLMKADLGMVSDEDLTEAMNEAAKAEDYAFAAKLRDELKGRKEGKKDVE